MSIDSWELGQRADVAQLRAALDALDDGVLVVDRDLSVVYANPALVAGLGRVPAAERLDELERAGYVVQRADGEPWALDERPVHLAARLGRATPGQLMRLQRGDRVRWVRVSAWPLLDADDGSPQGAVAVYTDVTDRETARQALVESETHFRLLAENSTDVITRHASDGTCLYASPALRELLGRDPADLEGRTASDFVHPDDRAALDASLSDLLRSGEVADVRYRLSHADGRWVWVETVIRPVRAEGRVLELQSSTRDVTARVHSEQRLARQALGDPLTGLANRAALLQQLEDRLAAGEPLALLFLDLDRFKVVNDSLGHSAGDELLRTVAGRLAATCRDGDVVARLGGDEFVVVASGLDEAAAVHLAERVQAVLSAPVEVMGHELVMSASVGIVVHDAADAELDAEALLHDADVSMYRAKGLGRARAVVWQSGAAPDPVQRLTLEQQLRTALDDSQLAVHYQPQVELLTGRVVGVEALVRWRHPVRGLLLPAEFLGVADDSGLIEELGRQVLRMAVQQVAAWRRLPGCADLALSVNLSTRELLDPQRPDLVRELLAEVGLPASALTLEVLEGVLLDAEGAVAQALEVYVRSGVGLALDDFGTGSSSLLHLRHVPVGTVKIDREFVAGLGTSRIDEAIVRALCLLTDDLGMSCIAEGVETPAQSRWLAEQGIAVAQGFLLHRPLPAEAVTELLVRDNAARPRG